MWLPRQRPLRDEQISFTLTIYRRISAKPEHLASIGLVVVVIAGRTGIVNNKQTRNGSRTYLARGACMYQPGGLNL